MITDQKESPDPNGHNCETLFFAQVLGASAERYREEHVKILEGRIRVVEDQLASAGNMSSAYQTHSIMKAQKNAEQQKNKSGDSRKEDASAIMYEGETSFTSQSVEARELAKTIANSSGVEMGSSIGGTFDSLESLLQSSANRQTSSRSDMPLPTVAKQSPLPADVALALLRDFQGMSFWNQCARFTLNIYNTVNKPMLFWSYPINDLSLVERLCQKIYFSTHVASPGDLAAVHGLFYFALREYLAKKDPLCEKFDFERYAEACRKSFHTEMESPHVLLVPSLENIIALIMGVCLIFEVPRRCG